MTLLTPTTPSDPNCNSPFTPSLPPPHHPGPLHAAFSPLTSMRVLSLTSSNRNSPSPCLSFYRQRNSNSAVLPGLKLRAEDTKKRRKLRVKYPFCSYRQSSAQAIVRVMHNTQRQACSSVQLVPILLILLNFLHSQHGFMCNFTDKN